MDSPSAIKIIILIILLTISAFFSSAETALNTVNKLLIRSLIDNGNKRAIIVGKLIDNSPKILNAILIGKYIIIISVASIATSLAGGAFGNYAVSLAMGIVTVLILIFGETVPQKATLSHAETFLLRVSYILYAITGLLSPLVFLTTKISYGILRIFGVDLSEKTNTITENELRSIVDISHEERVIEKEERQMIKNLFNFSDSHAKEFMVPRINMTSISVDCSYEELIAIFRRDHYTRIPVYQDSPDNVIGIINMKDLLLYSQAERFDIKNYLREAYYTYEYKNLFELMVEMRKTAINCIIVLDEYGATAGLITLEDLLEEIVGEIRDEYDYDEEDPIVKISDTEYIVEGHMKLGDINEMLDINLETYDYDTIGGYIMGKLDRLPATGDTVKEDTVLLTVESVDKNRINKVHIRIEDYSN